MCVDLVSFFSAKKKKKKIFIIAQQQIHTRFCLGKNVHALYPCVTRMLKKFSAYPGALEYDEFTAMMKQQPDFLNFFTGAAMLTFCL